MKKLNLPALLITASILLAALQAFPCSRIPDTNLSIIGSYRTGEQVNRSDMQTYAFGGCDKFADQYIILQSAPVYTTPKFKGISAPSGELPEEKCSIANSPFKVSSPLDIGIDNFYQEESSFMNICLQAEVTDSATQGLDVQQIADDSGQVNCQVTQISKNTAIVSGPRCAFKIHAKSETETGSSFTVHYKMNSECLSKQKVKDYQIRPMDTKASIQMFIAADLNPGTPNYEQIGSINARVTLQPDSDLLPISKYAGTAGSNWPMQFGAQVELGKVLFTRTARMHNSPILRLGTPFMINNNCAEVCKDGICSSPCDFYAPVTARMTLKKKDAGGTTMKAIDYWTQGNIVPARFLGEIPFGRVLPDHPVNVGDVYELTAEFSNPGLSYKTLVEESKQMMIKIGDMSIHPKTSLKAGLPSLGELTSTNSNPQATNLPSLGILREESMSIDPMLFALNNIIGTDSSWPPYYTSIISDDGKQADNPNRVYLKLKVSFRIANVYSSGSISVDQVKYSKQSKIFGNTTDVTTPAPEIKCEM